MLEVKDLHAYYGKSHILQGVDMHIDAGEVVSLLGRNGVGRSTTVKAIMGEVPPQGTILFKGGNIAGLPSYRIAHLGLGYVPEHRDIFPGLTVRQNLMLGIKDPKKPGKWRMEDMLEMFPNLAARADTAAGVMSGGEKQMLTICRTLMGDPELVMIDGCPLECGANTLRLAGITEFKHFKLHDHGVRKHDSEVSEETVERLAEAAAQLLAPVPA